MKATFDFLLGVVLLLVLSPLILLASLLIWAQDFRSPFYIATRVGRDGTPFRMCKFRSMVMGAHKTGVMSTAGDDRRITAVGALIRRFKLDEVPQLFNIVAGTMSFVGPRPNVQSEVDLYSREELGLLAVRPGITDYASIVFSDEGDILRGSADPDRDYNLLIRPWKSRLGLHYIRTHSFWTDLRIMVLTGVAVVNRELALRQVERMLETSSAGPSLVRVARRRDELRPTLPPGAAEAAWQEHLTYKSHP